ncbi:right-handed parallel beta-helix repeat-containing protein [Polaribacter litorisediminis]|uniref:discoidin domain-containing protein n=1 Tax=Polaribacter litorisediminis TaxID=1908341 RepID=UPI001CC18E5B|nr:discoidin domain-containing protein [Polaribacter litorisediminis]UAM98406.1 right-handed parallel beta-helix repeat-containing protein [Polaribacter litorisediminis]
MKKFCLFLITLCISSLAFCQNQNFIIDHTFPYHVNEETLGSATIGGDTIFISSSRTNPLRFQFVNGDANTPLVIINKGGQVKIDSGDTGIWGAITFENCRYIKISGAGHPNYKYGFKLSAVESGLAFADLSSDCEAEFIKIDHDGFFGIVAKKDYEGNPPFPYPVFKNLIIHDCFIENVSEGMYLGETQTPGMEFKQVRIYNNIVRNTLRESIQIANMVEDIEIYNNTLLNAGLENIPHQTNILQIGNNSVVNAYNNILIGAPSNGIIALGKGDCTFTNNYIASNLGVFVDNRSVSDQLAPVNINQNYFREINGTEIIKNYNEINYITAENNYYDTDITFFLNESGNANNFTVANNCLARIPEIEFEDPSKNDYSVTNNNPTEYQQIGAPSGPEYFETAPQQIKITSEMVTDLVEGGSINSPLFLFDEQNLNITIDEHAQSVSWKPANAMNNSSYHVVIDLGKHYYISEINLHDMDNSADFTVEYGNETNWETLFTDPCDTYNTWSKNETDVTTRFLRFSMYQNVFAFVNEIIIYGYPVVKESKQIVILPTMVTDLVQGGSLNSPLFLFDEQDLNLVAEESAVSNSWKPANDALNAPYYAIIDLGKEYYISEFNLHDMNDKQDFTVEYGNPNYWSPLFVDSLDNFQSWNTHNTDISTQYLRLSMLENPYAAVNEIIIYGYPLIDFLKVSKKKSSEDKQIIITSNMIKNSVKEGSVRSARLLFNEEHLEYTSEMNASSNSWKLADAVNNESHDIIFDLGKEYYISKINLHDMQQTKKFTLAYGSASNWTTLFIDPYTNFNHQNETKTAISTRYLRFSMDQNEFVSVNEIYIFGRPIVSKSANRKTVEVINCDAPLSNPDNIVVFNSENIVLYPNPVNQKLYLKFPLKMTGKSNLLIKDLLGKTLYHQQLLISEQNPFLELTNFQLPKIKGVYIMSILHESGDLRNLRFLKE